MLSLGNKEAVINSTKNFKITNAGVDTFAANVATLDIYGFGQFNKSQVKKGSGSRYVAGTKAGLLIKAPTAAEIGLVSADDVAVATVMHLRLFSSNDSSEWANDFIKRGRPVIFEITLNYGENASAVADKIVAAFTAYGNNFSLSAGLPFTFAKTTVGTEVFVELKSKFDDLSFSENVEFLRRFETFGYKATAAQKTVLGVTGATTTANATTIPMTSTAGLKVGDKFKIYDVSAGAEIDREFTILTIASSSTVTVAAGSLVELEATDVIILLAPGTPEVNSGKYLEENVRMGTAANAAPYGLGAGEVPVLTSGYSQITWTADIDANGGVAKTWAPHKDLAIVAAGTKSGDREQVFTLYFNEDSNLFATGGVVSTLVDWLIDTAGIAATDFVLADNSTPADGDEFVA